MIKKKKRKKRIEIDTTGPDGNAFVLLAYAKQFSLDLNLDYKKIQQEMVSGDYENLKQIFDKYFGEYVDLLV